MNNKIIILSGGTGGHVIPAVNFGNYLISEGNECILFIDQRGNNYTRDFLGKTYIIQASHFSGNHLYKVKSFFKLIKGFFKSLILLNKIKPSKCISFGSYATFSPLLSVLILKIFKKIDIYIHEQNSVIGKVNLFFLKFTKIFFTNFHDVKNLKFKYIKKKYYVGLPQKLNSKKKQSKVFNGKKILFIYAGSQGSVPLTKKILLILEKINDKHFYNIKIVIQSPKNMIVMLKKIFIKLNIEYEIQEFFINIEEILSITSLAITRAGSGTINDIIKYKVPSIIIPLPHSIYNHQYYNAQYLLAKKASILIEENNFDNDKTIGILNKLFDNNFDNNDIKNMKNKLNKISLPDCNHIMLKRIFNEQS